jgi:hypothetical protein
MPDKRVEILNSEYSKWVAEKGFGVIYPPNFPAAYKDAAINAMDENGKQMCLELLEYMAKNEVNCFVDRHGRRRFEYNGDEFTSEQLFENFL